MKDMNELVEKLVADIEESPADVPAFYEVWAIGYDEADCATEAELLLGTFGDPDQAVSYAKTVTLADVVNLAADEEYDNPTTCHSISIEVETVVLDTDDALSMCVGTIYKKRLEIFEELPDYVTLDAGEYELLENNDIKVPQSILRNYNKNDYITAIFDDDGIPQPMIYKIISKTTDGFFICELA